MKPINADGTCQENVMALLSMPVTARAEQPKPQLPCPQEPAWGDADGIWGGCRWDLGWIMQES